MPLIIREIQIKTIMRYHLTPVGLASSINQQHVLAWMWRKGTLVFCGWECRLVQPLWKTVWDFLKIMYFPQKIKMELPYDPGIPLLGIYLKKSEVLVQKNVSIPMFIAPLFAIAEIWKQPKCPSVNEWIKQADTFTQWNTTWVLKKRRKSKVK